MLLHTAVMNWYNSYFNNWMKIQVSFLFFFFQLDGRFTNGKPECFRVSRLEGSIWNSEKSLVKGTYAHQQNVQRGGTEPMMPKFSVSQVGWCQDRGWRLWVPRNLHLTLCNGCSRTRSLVWVLPARQRFPNLVAPRILISVAMSRPTPLLQPHGL